MNYQHANLANGRWFELSLAEQMGNIGSEVERYMRWQTKGNLDQATKAFYRALELMDLSKTDKRWSVKLREIARLREVFCDTVTNKSQEYNTPIEFFQKYFFQFALVARKNR